MMDPIGEAGDSEYWARTVELTPTQLNDVILEKLTHLKPAFDSLLCEMERFKEDLSNGKIHWKTILDRAKLNSGWDVRTEGVG
jgi:hypothetical protein